MTRMLSPVSCASCSRMCLVGFGVAANADFRVSSCLALIVVLGPRRFAPADPVPPPADVGCSSVPPSSPLSLLVLCSPTLLLLVSAVLPDPLVSSPQLDIESMLMQSSAVHGGSRSPLPPMTSFPVPPCGGPPPHSGGVTTSSFNAAAPPP